jgi:ribosomal protein S18 acetylase RimI-like enzyme
MQIRPADASDIDVIVAFNCGIARETEQIELLPDVIRAGVRALFENPADGFYVLVEIEAAVVGSLMITTEWSDWRNGVFWWVQSVYVKPDHRRKGIYRAMYKHVKQLAQQDDTVCGFRLYVEQENTRAQQTYAALGMQETPYRIFEELKPGTRFCSDA